MFGGRTTGRGRPGRSHRCQLFMADSACSQRSGRPRRRIGQHGWMRSPSSGLACPAQLIVSWLLWSKAQRAVCAKQRRRKTFYKEKAGKRAPAGTLPTKAPGRHSPAMQARANGLTAGSFTRRGLAIFTIATACHRLGPCYARKAGHTLVHGCQQCRANQHSPSPRRPCSWRCGAACVYPCRLAQTVAAPAPVVGSRSTSTGTMPCRAKIVERAWVRVARKGGRIRWASHPSTMARAHNRTWSAS